MLYGYRHTDVDNDIYNDSNSEDYYNYDGYQQTAESTSASSIPTLPSTRSTDSEDSTNSNPNNNNNKSRVNKIITMGSGKITRLKDLGLNDPRVIINTSFTWEINNWSSLAINPTDGSVYSPRIRIEGYSWRFILYPGGNQDCDVKDSTTCAFVSLYIRARPLEKVEFPTSAEFTLEMSNPDVYDANPENGNTGCAARPHNTISQDMQNQILSYTPVIKGFDLFVPLQKLADVQILTPDERVNITAKLRLMRRQ